MKKLFIYGTMALMALTSCNDFLDKAPLDAFTNTPAYWSNTSNLDNQCNTFYNNYSGYGNGSGGGWFYFKTLSDDQVDYQSTVWTYTSVVATSTNWSDLVVVGKSASMADFSFLKKKWQNNLDLLTEKVA